MSTIQMAEGEQYNLNVRLATAPVDGVQVKAAAWSGHLAMIGLIETIPSTAEDWKFENFVLVMWVVKGKKLHYLVALDFCCHGHLYIIS